jgi:hypothetical protein
MNSTSLRIGITIIAANSYDISELELQSLREIVTISQSWNYKHCYKYLQCLIVRIAIIAENSYNISDCNQTLAPPFSITKIHAFLVNSAQRSYLSSKFEQHGTESTATDPTRVSSLLAEMDCYARRRLHTCHAGHGFPVASTCKRRRCQSSAQRRSGVTGEDGSDLSLALQWGGGLASPSQEEVTERRKEEDLVWLCDLGLWRNVYDDTVRAPCGCGE